MVSNSTRTTPLICSGQTRPVTSLSFSGVLPDGSYYMLLGCKDKKALLRDGKTGDWQGTFLGHKGAIWSVSLSRDSTIAATGSADFSVRVWDAYTGKCLAVYPHSHIVRAVDISVDGKQLASGGFERRLRLYDLSNYDAEPTIFRRRGTENEQDAHNGTIKAVVWEETGRNIASIGEDNTLRLWDVRTGEVANERTFTDIPTSLSRNWDSSLLSLTSGKDVHFLNVSDITTRKSHTFDYTPSWASIHPDPKANRFVTGAAEEGWVRVHDTNTGNELEINKGHHGPVYCVSYSSDGELYASASEDGTVRMWQPFPKTFGLWVRVNGEAG